ncbi:hypothetical protein LB517_28130 [Mesorhizobium sp. BR1-1-12]|uniref:hypothetical protein n=1 Tax=Mesorhizobium sp. BR1-1-12 TaxID=2876657 RepID=UPI001CD048D6|nr:hypothetical protein [Mesorhizobium sp. BR1-1-12]MBZ9973502.1 hypothetical protein [Mesorhizobium sp. BR1-1-12]
MSDFSCKVHPALGGDTLVVESGGAIQILTGGKFLNNAGTQAAALVPPAATAAALTSYGYTQTQADAIVTWIRAADAALKAAGITA